MNLEGCGMAAKPVLRVPGVVRSPASDSENLSVVEAMLSVMEVE